MRRIVGVVSAGSVGKKSVQPLGVASQKDAQEGGNPHGNQHIDRSLLGPLAGIVSEKGKEGNFDSGLVKDPGGCEEQAQPNQHVPILGGFRNDDRFADETTEERERGNRSGPHDAESGGPRHGLVQPAKMGSANFPGPEKHRAHTHEKQTLVKHVSEGMGDGSVDRQIGSDADAHDHKSNLIDFTVAKHPARSFSITA